MATASRKRFFIRRFVQSLLMIALSLALSLPNTAWALRQLEKVEYQAGLEELTQTLVAPRAAAKALGRVKTWALAAVLGISLAIPPGVSHAVGSTPVRPTALPRTKIALQSPTDPYEILRLVDQAQVTIVGHRHNPRSEAPPALTALIPLFKQRRVAVVIEHPENWYEEFQRGELDQYYRITQGASYLAMLKQLERAKIRLVFGDLPREPYSPDPDTESRDAHFLQILEKLARDPKVGRIVLLIGALHVDPLTKGLQNLGVSVRSVTLDQGRMDIVGDTLHILYPDGTSRDIPLPQPRQIAEALKVPPSFILPRSTLEAMLQRFEDTVGRLAYDTLGVPNDFDHGHLLVPVPTPDADPTGPPGWILWHTRELPSGPLSPMERYRRSWVQRVSALDVPDKPVPAAEHLRPNLPILMGRFLKYGSVDPPALHLGTGAPLRFPVQVNFERIDLARLPVPLPRNSTVVRIRLRSGETVYLLVTYETLDDRQVVAMIEGGDPSVKGRLLDGTMTESVTDLPYDYTGRPATGTRDLPQPPKTPKEAAERLTGYFNSWKAEKAPTVVAIGPSFFKTMERRLGPEAVPKLRALLREAQASGFHHIAEIPKDHEARRKLAAALSMLAGGDPSTIVIYPYGLEGDEDLALFERDAKLLKMQVVEKRQTGAAVFGFFDLWRMIDANLRGKTEPLLGPSELFDLDQTLSTLA